MKNLNRNQNQVTTQQVGAYQQGKLRQELESYKQQSDQLWQQIEEKDQQIEEKGSQVESLQKEVEETSEIVSQERTKSEGLLQRLMNAIQSRNSMRGKLGSATARLNRTLQQVETLGVQKQEVFEQLKNTTDKLGEAYQQISSLHEEYDQDMTALAQAYRIMTPEQRETLPAELRQLLDQIDENYWGQS